MTTSFISTLLQVIPSLPVIVMKKEELMPYIIGSGVARHFEWEFEMFEMFLYFLFFSSYPFALCRERCSAAGMHWALFFLMSFLVVHMYPLSPTPQVHNNFFTNIFPMLCLPFRIGVCLSVLGFAFPNNGFANNFSYFLLVVFINIS